LQCLSIAETPKNADLIANSPCKTDTTTEDTAKDEEEKNTQTTHRYLPNPTSSISKMYEPCRIHYACRYFKRRFVFSRSSGGLLTVGYNWRESTAVVCIIMACIVARIHGLTGRYSIPYQ
jgi:hypothetical protein